MVVFSKKELRKQREDIGMIFQHFNLLMQKSVLENICFPLYIHGKKKTEARKRAKELLEIVGLSDKAKAYPAQLSGGQNRELQLQEHWHQILKFFFVMKQQVL